MIFSKFALIIWTLILLKTCHFVTLSNWKTKQIPKNPLIQNDHPTISELLKFKGKPRKLIFSKLKDILGGGIEQDLKMKIVKMRKEIDQMNLELQAKEISINNIISATGQISELNNSLACWDTQVSNMMQERVMELNRLEEVVKSL